MEEMNSEVSKRNLHPEDLDFDLWKAELNKELASFWKSLKNFYQE